MNYDQLPSRGKVTSDGEYTKPCWCSGRCYVFYDENENYHVECENCGVVVRYKTNSADWAIKMWNDMPTPLSYCEGTKRNYDFRHKTELRMLKNYISMMPKTYRKRNANYKIVMDLITNGTSYAGQTSAIEKCNAIGIDPWGYELKEVK